MILETKNGVVKKMVEIPIEGCFPEVFYGIPIETHKYRSPKLKVSF